MLLGLSAGFPGYAPAQKEAPAQSRYGLAEALDFRRVEYRRSRGLQANINVLEWNSLDPRLVADAVVLDGRAWSGAPLETVLESTQAEAAWQALAESPAGPTCEWPGWVAAEGALLAGPGTGPHLVITHDGYASLVDFRANDSGAPAPPLAVLTQENGARATILALNRRPPQSDGAAPQDSPSPTRTTDAFGAVLMTDAPPARDSFWADRLPAPTLAFRLDPARNPRPLPLGPQFRRPRTVPVPARALPTTVAEAITVSLDRPRPWDPATVASRDAFTLLPVSADAAALTSDSAILRFDARRPATLSLPSHERWGSWRAAVPLGRWLLFEGNLTSDLLAAETDSPEDRARAEARWGPRIQRSAVGWHSATGRFFFVFAEGARLDSPGLNRRELAQLLRGLGADYAAEGPLEQRASLSLRRTDTPFTPPRSARCRLAIVFRRLAAVETDTTYEDLAHASGTIAVSSRPQDWLSDATRTVDRRRGPLGEYNHLWISPTSPEGAAPWLEYDFTRERTVVRIDLGYAQEAGLSADFNTRAVRVLTRLSSEDEWTNAGLFENPAGAPAQKIQFARPISTRWLRLVFEKPTAFPMPQTARVVETSIWGVAR